MKFRHIFILVWIACITASGIAQSSASPPPLVMEVTNICSGTVRLWRTVPPWKAGVVSFALVHDRMATNEDMIREAVKSRGLIEISDGNCVIARATFIRKSHGMEFDSYTLEFESVKSAAEAASKFRELGSVDLPKIDTNDRSHWKLQTETLPPIHRWSRPAIEF